MLWLCISVAFHSLLLVISLALYWTPLSHMNFKAAFSEDQISSGAAEPLCPPQPLSLPGNTCRLCILNELAPSLDHATASFWNNLQMLFFMFAVPLEANSSAFSCFLSLLRLLVKEGYSWCWNSRTNI